MSSRMPCTQEPWVLWPAKNCTMCFITPQKSHFQATIMQKMNSYKGMFPWTAGFTSRKNRIFWSQKWRKSTQTKRSTHEQWVTRLGKNRIFMLPEWRKWPYTKICTLEPFVKRVGRNSFFRQPKCRKWAHTNVGNLNRGYHDSQKSHIKNAKKQKMSSHEARYPGNVGYTTRQKLHFQG